MKILLIGASGAMGQSLVQYVTNQTDHQVTVVLQEQPSDTQPYQVFTTFEEMGEYLKEHSDAVDVMIDFSTPRITDDVVAFAVEQQLPLLIATTGQNEAQQAKIKAASAQVPILDTHNVSIGVNVMEMLVAQMSKILYPLGYDIEIIEKHHRYKKDSPSGTAVMLLDSIRESIEEETTTLSGRDGLDYSRPHSEIGVHAIRSGDIVGEHTVLFGNNQETIELTHRAGTKDLFVRGALAGAEYLVGAKAGLYDMHDVIDV